MVEFGEAPINKAQLLVISRGRLCGFSWTYFFSLMIYHDVVRLYISMHYAFAVTEVQGLTSLLADPIITACFQPCTYLEQLKDVVSHIVVHEFGIQASEVRIVDALEYQRRRLALAISHDVQQGYNVRPTRQIL